MFGVADDSFDCTNGHPTHPDPNAKLGAGFTSMGWGLYNYNGGSYHDTKGTGQQGHEAWKVVPNVATNGSQSRAPDAATRAAAGPAAAAGSLPRPPTETPGLVAL